jgi:hypothetical protein
MLTLLDRDAPTGWRYPGYEPSPIFVPSGEQLRAKVGGSGAFGISTQ